MSHSSSCTRDGKNHGEPMIPWVVESCNGDAVDLTCYPTPRYSEFASILLLSQVQMAHRQFYHLCDTFHKAFDQARVVSYFVTSFLFDLSSFGNLFARNWHFRTGNLGNLSTLLCQSNHHIFAISSNKNVRSRSNLHLPLHFWIDNFSSWESFHLAPRHSKQWQNCDVCRC